MNLNKNKDFYLFSFRLFLSYFSLIQILWIYSLQTLTRQPLTRKISGVKGFVAQAKCKYDYYKNELRSFPSF